jgi:HPt (histidine-containing phosphotransfer) domain-containing protein
MEEVLRDKYRASFTDKVNQLESALAEDNRQVLLQKVHQLAGSSGSYGFNELAGCCAEIEEVLMSDNLADETLDDLLNPLLKLLKDLAP